MRRVRGVVLTLALLAALVGCGAKDSPTYAQVRSETLEVLQQVADLIPEARQISRTPEFEPYSCEDPMVFGSRSGSFFTGQWVVLVPDDFDVDEFVRTVPERLGPGWKEEPMDVPVSFAQVQLVREDPRMSLTVEASVPGDPRAVELLAMSRCGAE